MAWYMQIVRILDFAYWEKNTNYVWGCKNINLDNTIYQATAKEEKSGKVETYTGIHQLEARLAVNKFNHGPMAGPKSSNGTELSKHIWELKDNKRKYTLSWKIMDWAKLFNPSTKMCRLCLTEKYHLMYSKDDASLNKRT